MAKIQITIEVDGDHHKMEINNLTNPKDIFSFKDGPKKYGKDLRKLAGILKGAVMGLECQAKEFLFLQERIK